MRPVSVAQAWWAPALITLAGAVFAAYGAVKRPESYLATVGIVMMLAVPALSTALIVRGLVGLYRGARVPGACAVLLGIALFVALVLVAQGYQGPVDPGAPRAQW
jgi:hypothetical protein